MEDTEFKESQHFPIRGRKTRNLGVALFIVCALGAFGLAIWNLGDPNRFTSSDEVTKITNQ